MSERSETWTRPGSSKAMLGAVAVVLLLVLSACGNLTAGGVAQAEAVVTGDGSDGEGAQAVASDQLVEPPLEGSVTVRLAVYLIGPDQEPIDISGGTREITLDIHGETSVSLGTISISPDTYAGLRVVFSHVEATLVSDLPLVLPTIVTVDFEGEPTIEVERATLANVEDGGRLVATVDLRAPGWLQGVILGAPRVVPGALFRSLVHLSLE
jgi:hypothetical protein